MGSFKEVSSIVINGKTYNVVDSLPGDITLNEFIRNFAHLKGTKFMCQEGGCGACVVSVKSKHPDTGATLNYAVNSCLVPLMMCKDWEVTTVEGLGGKNHDHGYHDIQARLAKGNGSQCGYCSVGMVMNMYSLLKDKPELSMMEIENSFGGNLCRCTGYRPILDSFKSFAKDAPKELVRKCADIEDLLNICPVKKKPCASNGHCNGVSCPLDDTEVVQIQTSSRVSLQDGTSWYHVTDKREIFEILDMCEENNYMLVGGNTAHGVYRIKSPLKHYISLHSMGPLHTIVEAGGTIVLGANNSLTATMRYFYDKSSQEPRMFSYLKQLADHIDLIANVPVRNTGTLAGNLSIKHQHREFPSDLFLILETVGATIVVEDSMEEETTMSPQEYLDFDMTKKLMTKIIMPSIDSTQYVVRTFKIMPRAQNAHAYVNAGFKFKVDKKDKYRVIEKPNIVFGGISPGFVHASSAENVVVGQQLLSPNAVKAVVTKLKTELKADHQKPDASPEYRQGLACSLFYKFVLGLSPENVDARLRSGGEILIRPLSSGHQEIATDKSIYPVSKPITKLEALAQCAGEAEYVNDIPNLPGGLYGAFVVSTVGPADNFHLDFSEAMKMPGVVAYQTAKDVPGRNSILYPVGFGGVVNEPIYADKHIPYAGACLAGVFATSHAQALKAASKVKVTYEGVKKPEIDLKKVVASKDGGRIYKAAGKKADSVKTNVKHKVKGEFFFPQQYHFTMETQSCVAVPAEDGIDVFPATQCPTQVHNAIAEALNIPRNSVNLKIRRCGGGYGSKLGKSGTAAVPCAVAAYTLQKPVHLVMSIESNMAIVGKRAAAIFYYEAGVDDDGLIQYLNVDYYQDDGWNKNDSIAGGTMAHFNSIYDTSSWTINGYGVKTDLPSMTWCRAPGTTEALGAVESIMEHIAVVVNKDPVSVKMINKRPDDISLPFPAMVDHIKSTSDYDKRVKAIDDFNKTNRWKKRGIALVPMDYLLYYFGNYHAMVTVYGADGSVSVTHGCVEIGQGLNTKVAQVVAYVLGIDVELVSVKPTRNLTAPNDSPTGGSSGSECAAYAAKKACEQLNKRLEPVRKANPNASWKELVAKAMGQKVDLNSSYMFTTNDDPKNYSIFGAAVVEVELDILTGQHLILRADVLEDCGISLSPEVDLGQIEGAFVMGLGLYTSEELVYQEDTGRLLTDRTWNYKVPGAKDIPIDFRVEMRKDAPNPIGVLKSKATGEPPLNMSIVAVFAIRRALEAARRDAGIQDTYFNIELPLTAEKIWMYSATSPDQFHL